MPKAFLIVGENLGVVEPQFMGSQQNLAEIDHAAAVTGLFISPVNLQHSLGVAVVEVFDIGGPEAFVFLRVDIPLALFCRPFIFVDLQGAIDALDQPELVVAVENLKVLYQAGFPPVVSKQPVGKPVEGANPHAVKRLAEQRFDAAAHFSCRLVGECNRQDREGRRLLRLQQPGDTVHQHPGLATARTRQHQQVGRGAGNRITLWLVERIEYVRNIHGAFYQNVCRNPGLMWAFIVVSIPE